MSIDNYIWAPVGVRNGRSIPYRKYKSWKETPDPTEWTAAPPKEPWEVRAAAMMAEEKAKKAAAKAEAKAAAKAAAETAGPKVCPKCGKQYSRCWVRLYDRDVRYRHAGQRAGHRVDCFVPYEVEEDAPKDAIVMGEVPPPPKDYTKRDAIKA